jgi:hypothetical protein
MVGRFEFDVHSSGVDSTEIYPNCIGPFLGQREEDPVGFIADLRHFVVNDDSGFVTYGASCLIRELITDERLRNSPDALAVLTPLSRSSGCGGCRVPCSRDTSGSVGWRSTDPEPGRTGLLNLYRSISRRAWSGRYDKGIEIMSGDRVAAVPTDPTTAMRSDGVAAL